ncbi:hypothetical protein OEA41_008242 [Lepraria neglecta]|uniref:ARM repeat-containing protein n=1 Tax=Lepraria neglecta TaxID=209136 RepID=A0AAD9ZEL7_9LECA|nr:hypothetical protein OEA41_008242 [Lepraria neglecta]
MDEARVTAFRALKPPCVELSQVALRYKGKKATANDLIKALEDLQETLLAASKQANALDSKLAEYAFFPLSYIFRDTKELPVRAVELALQCLQILVAHGWQGQLSPDLGKQLLILLSFLAGGSATDAKVKDVNEELGTAAFDCLAALFGASRGSFLGSNAIQSQDVPILGHTVTVMLDGVTDGPSVKVRLAALAALNNMINGITDDEALKNVFPGIVSSLTKVLSSKSGAKPSYRVLTASLATLTKILCKVISDDKVGESSEAQADAVAVIEAREDGESSWATATAGQVKMALANILPLRYHERPEVRAALFKLCISVIQQCRRSLSQSIPMLTDTLIVLCSQASETEAANIFTLNGILAADASLLEIVKSSLHDWIVALPRVMQSNDDARKRKTIEQISTSFRVLQNQDIRLDILNDSMAVNLRASVAAAIQDSSKSIRPVSESGLEVTQLLQSQSRSMSFVPVLFNESSSRTTMTGLQKLAVQLKALPRSISLQQGIVSVNTLRSTSGDEQLASFWLSLQLLNDASVDASAVDQHLNLPPEYDAHEHLLDEVYSFSLDVLAKSTFEDEDRWKLQALALETVALQARNQKYDFRPELVDALYPILERLGSNNAALQQHAMTCLNIVSNSCDYPDSASLIVDNADYLANAVALKLNTFDISPQAPQVLVMMVRLCGSALIPYLDDLVESIFSILACYHGYLKLVESLFSVLNAIVEEAAKSSTPAIEANSEKNRPRAYQPISIADLASILRTNLEQTTRPLSPPPEPTLDPEEEQPSSPPRPSSPPPAPLSKTDTLITSIASLTPSHLTTPSPALRLGILTLLTSALPILTSNTDNFLPIAATLWPVTSIRLYDSKDNEPSTTLAAANALSILCKCAGDFLASRVEDDWDQVCKLYRRVEKEMKEESRIQGKGKGKGNEIAKASTGRGVRWKAWNAVVGLLLVTVRDVGVTSEMEDGIFEMLGWLAPEREDVRDVLEMSNADTLWLIEEKARGKALVKPHALEGVHFRDVKL